MNDFTKEPVSIAELRVRKTQNGKDWTPRDALVDTLRRIDSGEISPAFAVIVLGSETSPGDTHCRYVQATPNLLVGLGLLAQASMLLNRDGECGHE